ncbi:tetratricopeptide repeat protein [Tamlana sp. I1]|uniref:tetratricopeptide repeat protein n=1 Tax=Tamlana sp. I1 TaxID=2762061 RepID=UPI00188EF95B|nr:tetratricopeptide repeat protein [Tamlana sp. I1]
MKKLFFTLLVIMPLISIGQANKLYRQALKTTDLNKKIALLNEVIDLEPKNLDAYFQRGLAKNDSGDYSGAIVDYSKVIVEQPDADTYYNRGNSRYSMKDFKEAKEDYAKAYILDENFIDALYSLACVRFDLGEYEKAIIDFNKVIKAVPSQPKTYILRASAYKALENYQKALEDYSTAILIEASSDNYFSRGEFFMEIKQYQNANIDLTNAIILNKNNAFAYFYRGVSNLLLSKYKDAVSDFSTVLNFDSNDFDANLGLAMAYNKLNDTAKAKQHFDRANAILNLHEITNIAQYSNTYWFENQYHYLNIEVSKLVKL